MHARRLAVVLAGFLAGCSLMPGGDGSRERSLALGVSVTAEGYAVSGYDAVTLLERGNPVSGSPAHAVLGADGATYLFASAETRAKFEADQERYMPRFGGWCSWALMARNDKRPKDPVLAPSTVYHAYKGRLYGFCNEEVRALWLEAPDYFIAFGEKGWEVLQRAGKV